MARWHLSLKTVAAVAFLAVAAVPVWLAWELPQSVAIRLEREQAADMHVAYTNAVIRSLERYYTDVETSFGMMADDLDPSNAPVTRDRGAAMEALGIHRICVFDAVTGEQIGESKGNALPCPDRAEAEQLAILRALAIEGRVRISGVQVNEQGKPEVMLVRRTGTAITAGSLGTDYFRELASTISFGRKGHAAIVDHKGHLLAHPNTAWVDSPKSMIDVGIVQQVMAGQSGTGEFFSPALKETMISAFGSVQGPGWGILVNQPESEMEFIVTEIKQETFKVLLIAVALATLLSMLAAHLLLDPIRRIRLAAEKLGQSERMSLIPPTGAGSRLIEINDLRAAFNAMALRVRRSHRTEIAARREAQEATRMKSRFLANMSHELRTPLNAIIGFAEVTQRRMAGANRERDHEYLGYIHDSGVHLLSIINDLLDLSRMEAGAWQLNEEDVDVSHAVRDARAMLGTLPEEKNITIVLKGIDEPVMIWADRRAIRQILLNLIMNAVRYTQEGGLVVVVCRIGEAGAISLTIEDNGPGIDTEEMAKIRAPFLRGQAHEMAAVPGAGLGLSIVDALSDLHDARFDLTSKIGQGTRAHVMFPPNRTLLTLVHDSDRAAAQ